jgi:hypothetical protein
MDGWMSRVAEGVSILVHSLVLLLICTKTSAEQGQAPGWELGTDSKKSKVQSLPLQDYLGMGKYRKTDKCGMAHGPACWRVQAGRAGTLLEEDRVFGERGQ